MLGQKCTLDNMLNVFHDTRTIFSNINNKILSIHHSEIKSPI